MTQHLSQPEWVAIAAHRLHYRWRSINPRQLDELALDLWKDEHLRGLEPVQAVDLGEHGSALEIVGREDGSEPGVHSLHGLEAAQVLVFP